MKRKFVQIAALSLAMALLISGGVLHSTAAGTSSLSGTVIRVGLAYGSAAQDGANLANSNSSGYRFGYYDSSNQFVELAFTAETNISVVKTTNVGYTANPTSAYCNYLESLANTASVAVGCYHLQLDGAYSSYDEALAAASQYKGGFAAYIGDTYYARIGNYLTKTEAETAQAELVAKTAIVGTSAYGVSVVVTGTNTILFQYDDQGAGTGLGVQPGWTDGAETATAWFRGYEYAGGFRFERINGGSLTVVNMVGLEDYVKGVIPYEMSASWPLEALKAQAVAARTYVLRNLNSCNSSYHFDVDNTNLYQVYRGVGSANSNSDAAVDSTAGIVATYNGSYATCAYYSSNGGVTIDSSVVWGGNQSNYPYLVGVIDPYEASVASMISNYNWSYSFTGSELAAKLTAKGYKVSGSIVSIAVSSTTDLGLPKQIVFTDSAGKNYTLSTYVVYTMLGLRSYNYSIGEDGVDGTLSINGSSTVSGTDGLYAIDGNGNTVAVSGSVYVITGSGTVTQAGGGSTGSNNGTFTFTGSGWGHNIGMSQWGAYAMAKQGYTYKEILEFYYTGITVG